MLTLRQITKTYSTGRMQVEALKGIDLEFRQSEFAAILGPSGCGKTTLLNLIGGLDQYTTGDLIIRGKSTKQFKEKDWDAYRNHAVGFVFQNYNLIPHQTVLANVELALTLSGVSRDERKRRAAEALEKVGLGDQLRKKPNELSGGQMQRVAIARALVNDPEILLADEPTGALDSETSIQVMDLLREIAQDRLVIMVTHNPELADTYATRIIRLLDGKVISDSHPPEKEGQEKTQEARYTKRSMSLLTALHLSLTNLLTKKGRTILTAFAGSIGIIGIALILSMSTGANRFIQRVERETLSSYPLEIDEQTIDMAGTMGSMMGITKDDRVHEEGKAYSGGRMTEMMSAWMSGVTSNDLAAFKAYLEDPETGMDELTSGIQYEYNTPLMLYRTDLGEEPRQVNPSTAMEATGMMDMMNTSSLVGFQETMMSSSSRRMNIFEPLLENRELLDSQYEVLAGRLPEAKDEVVIILSGKDELSDYALYSLWIKDQKEIRQQFTDLMEGKGIESEDMEFTYEELMALRFRLMVNTDYYEQEDNRWVDHHDDPGYIAKKLENALEIKVVGILKPAEGAVVAASSGAIGYRSDLMEYLLEQVENSEIVRRQRENPGTDVFSGQPFASDSRDLLSMLDTMETDEFLAKLEEMGLFSQDMIPAAMRSMLTKDMMRKMIEQSMATLPEGSAEKNLETVGCSNPENPAAILIYPKDFESKEKITALIDAYNEKAGEAGKIVYTDFVGLMMSSITTIIDAISYVLIAFVAVSLVVSSIMIGIITYISVLERTREIGILRAVGASKKDVARVFRAETLIIGFTAGAFGIGITLLLVGVVNIILKDLTGIGGIAALPPLAAVILILISMGLTLLAGLIPARLAARKDPVVALRSE